MVFSRFLWSILAHIAAIVVTSVALGIFLQKPDYPLTVSILIFLLAGEALSLFYYLIRIRRDLMKVTNALRYEDPSMQFSSKNIDPFFGEIHRSFNDIIKNFKLIRLDKEAQGQFFRATANHIQFGIVAFHEDGSVEMVNRSFLELFRRDSLNNINALKELSADIPDFLKDLPDQKEALKKMYFHNRYHHVILLASELSYMQKKITLVSIRDISKEIDNNEQEAWHKLLRVLKHEILNSLSPIQLLSGNLTSILKKSGSKINLSKLSADELDNLQVGLETIHRRANGISSFVEAYSNLYQVPELVLEKVKPSELIYKVLELMKEQLKLAGISHHLEIENEEMEFEMDRKLIEQVLINLIKNSMESLEHVSNKSIVITAGYKHKQCVISVIDTGRGILPEQIDSIFLPFYSTKAEGNGIGLNFARYVMRMHGGECSVRSNPGEGSEFKMIF